MTLVRAETDGVEVTAGVELVVRGTTTVVETTFGV